MKDKINWKTVWTWAVILSAVYLGWRFEPYIAKKLSSPPKKEKKEVHISIPPKAPIRKLLHAIKTTFDSAKYYKDRYIAEKAARDRKEDSLQLIIDQRQNAVRDTVSKKVSVKAAVKPRKKKKSRRYSIYPYQPPIYEGSNGRHSVDAHHEYDGDENWYRRCCCVH